MTNKQTKKAKRPLQTTLGKAPHPNEKEEVDLSHLKKPIETSIYGLHQVINLLKNATEEVKDYITYECDILYECRLCRSIFRSIANFILHKRNYCHVRCKEYTSSCRENNFTGYVYPPEPPEDAKSTTTKRLIPVIEKLKEKQEIKQITEELLKADLSTQNNEDARNSTTTEKDVLLEEIATNNAAVFQTMLHKMPQKETVKPECMKKEVLELHKILDSDKAALGADGKICSFQTNKLNTNTKNELFCTECNIKFSTRKTLSFHLKTKHNNSRLVYVCPDCKDTFCNAWSVYRHLFKIHRKSSAQVKRLREQVHNSVIRKDQETQKKVEKKDQPNADKADEENQWLNNIEGDNDFQMCGGCGKRFERKAALQSHAAMCIKRLAVCNTIKENNKKKEEGSKDAKTKLKLEKSPESSHLKGALKRKPYLLRTYKQIEQNCDSVSVKSLDNCDIRRCNVCNSYYEDFCDCSKVKNTVFEKEDVSREETDLPSLDNEEIKISQAEINTIQLDDRIEVIKEESPSRQLSASSEETLDLATKSLKQIEEKDTSEVQENCDVQETSAKSGNSSSQDDPSNEMDLSQGKISIRSMEELRGFTKETVDGDDVSIVEASASAKLSKSPKTRRLIKRKRTASLDTDRVNKTFKHANFDVLLDKQDLNFMARASPYIDRKSLMCKSCRSQHSSLSKLLWHMSAHFSWFRFQCSRCSFVSFSKSECASHAKGIHDIRNDEIPSVVLPIPNWKTLLMSNEFKELNSAHELGGKHTNEVNANCQTEPVKVTNDVDDQATSLISTLFLDSESDVADLQDLTDDHLFPMPKSEDATSIKNESIDITEDDHESFQLEVPEEIYTLDVFEVINIDNIDDTNTSVKKESENDFSEDVNKNQPSNEVNVRPTRNRMRSIKTLQNDFFYDMGKASKPEGVTVASKTINGSSSGSTSGGKKKNFTGSTVKKE